MNEGEVGIGFCNMISVRLYRDLFRIVRTRLVLSSMGATSYMGLLKFKFKLVKMK